MLTNILLTALVLLAGASVAGAFRERERLKNLKAAWPYREEFARVLGELESDSRTPAYIVTNLENLYARIFDERFLRCIASKGARTRPTPSASAPDLEQEFGAWHGKKIQEAVSAYSWVVMYSKVRVGFLLRLAENRGDTRTCETREAETAYLTRNILARPDDGPSNGGLRPV